MKDERAYNVIITGLKTSIRRYDFHGIKTKIKTLNEYELAEYLNIWNVSKFDQIIDENEIDRQPLSEQFYNNIRG